MFVCEQDLALNKPQWFICHKIYNHTKSNQSCWIFILVNIKKNAGIFYNLFQSFFSNLSRFLIHVFCFALFLFFSCCFFFFFSVGWSLFFYFFCECVFFFAFLGGVCFLYQMAYSYSNLIVIRRIIKLNNNLVQLQRNFLKKPKK